MLDLSASTSVTAAQAQQAASSASGGIFCFSLSNSSASSSGSHSAVSSVIGESLVIKVPGPQILGWFLEYMPEDVSTDYTPMPKDYLPATTDVMQTGKKQISEEIPASSASQAPTAPTAAQAATTKGLPTAV